MAAEIETYGETEDGDVVRRVTIRDGLRVTVLTYGGVLERIEVGGVNVALGVLTLDDYVHRSPSFGAAIGRYANRIGGARFTLDGVEHHLPANEGENCRHGGPRNFGKRVWALREASANAATLELLSADGDAGFPGALLTRMTYFIEGETLRIAYEASTDRPTVLNLTNHSYFNLAGEGAGDVFGHTLQLEADAFLETRPDAIPTGTLLPVAGTPFDFRDAHPIGERIRAAHPQLVQALGYDQCFVLRGHGLRRAATLAHEPSGRALEVWTDQPAMQVYTGNKLTGALYGPSERAYRSGDGVALETQHYPDSPNHPEFPSTVLRPGAVFRSATEYRFARLGGPRPLV